MFRSRSIFLLVLLPIMCAPAKAQTAAVGISMEIAGKSWVSTRSAAFKTMLGKTWALNINGFVDGPKIAHVGFTITPPTAGDYVHTFAIKQGTLNIGNYNVDMMGGNPLENGFIMESGEVVVTAFDAAKKTISGTFSGHVKNHTGTAALDITNGRFTDITMTP